MNAPLVSIVLPVRNAAATVGAALASLRAQTLPAWELLAVDDASTDGTAAVLAAAAQADPRIRILRSGAAPGLVAALHTGLAVARAPYIARMDADDLAHPDRLAQQVTLLEVQPDLGLASCLVDFGGDRAAHAGYALYVDWLNSLVTPDAIALNRFVESPLAHPSVLFRRELLAKHGNYCDGDFPEDYELWLRWLDAGVRMAKVPRVLLTWHDAPARLSRTDARYAPEKFFCTKAAWIARELARIRNGRAVWIWGAGRPTRKRVAHLVACGVAVAGYIDVDVKKHTRALGGTGVPVVSPEHIPPKTAAVVLGYVSSRGARDLIREELQKRDYVEGRDSLMCA